MNENTHEDASSPDEDAQMRDIRLAPADMRPWLAALGGQPPAGMEAESDDGTPAMNTNHALHLRQYFLQRAAMEDATPLGPESEARMLARLRAAGVIPSEPAPAAPQRRADPATHGPNLADRLTGWLEWLLPSGPGAMPRYATLGVIALAVMVAPLLFHPGTPNTNDPNGTLRHGQVAPLPSPELLVLSADPAQQVQQLRAALEAAGASVQVRFSGASYELSIDAAASQRAAVQGALAPWGMALPAQGGLTLKVQPLNPP